MLNWIQGNQWASLCQTLLQGLRAQGRIKMGPCPQGARSKTPFHRCTHLHFLFDVNLTRQSILLFSILFSLQFWSNVFLPNNHLLYWRTIYFFDSLRSVCIDASGNKLNSIKNPAISDILYWTFENQHNVILILKCVSRTLRQNGKMPLGEREADKSYSKVLYGLIISDAIIVNNISIYTVTLRKWTPSKNILTCKEDHDLQNRYCHQTQPEGLGVSGIFLVLDSHHLGYCPSVPV